MAEKRAIVEAIHDEVRASYVHILKNHYAYFSPMVVTQLLIGLKKLRHSLEELQTLPMRSQEELAWLILNACKLIYDIGQPLIWHSCGKYVIESLGFAALSMEAVINLCTIRHMNFRMKLYSSMFYAALSQGQQDQAQAVLQHCEKEIKELKEREELDPPLPEKSIVCLMQSTDDYIVMKFVLDCWKDSDAIHFTNAVMEKYRQATLQFAPQVYKDNGNLVTDLRNRCIEEFTRVHVLASGNMNETYMKRSASLAKALVHVLLEVKGQHADDLFTQLSLPSIFEVAYLNILDGNQTSAELSEALKDILQSEVEEESHEHFEKLQLLFSLQQLIARELSSETMNDLMELTKKLNTMIYESASYRSKSLYTKIALDLFRKVIYNPIQKSLSEKDLKKNEKFLKSISYPLITVFKYLDLTFAEDPILHGTVAVLCGHVLFHIRDFRGGISLLKQALHTLEDHRAARVDYDSHMPEDVRDILALQRASFTTRSDMYDWFQSVKRLGAHAFAGFGIFGLSSSTDRSDQALAEIHTDLLGLYFRIELHYSYITHKTSTLHRRTMAAKKAKEESDKLENNPKKTAAAASSSNKTVKNSTTSLATDTANIAATTVVKKSKFEVDTNIDVDVDKLAATHILKAYCCRNNYALCVLYMEMAKIDENLNRRQKYVEDAHRMIEEVEAQEEKLLNAFTNLKVMKDSERTYPIVLARNHRYIYVAPVACRKLKKATYYRVLAKEKGSGTDVSIYNDSMPGCEHKIGVEKLVDMKETVVRIGPLRNGELYCFGSAGYSESHQVVGGVSPTSPVVEAVNPLPTIVLWSLLAQVSHSIGYFPLSMDAALRVCHRFMIKYPIRDSISLSNGTNLFLYEETVLHALALQQSTTYLLHHFVDSFVRYELLYFQQEMFGSDLKYNQRASIQLRYLQSLQRCIAVVTVTTSLGSQDLTMKCISLANMLLTELLRFDVLPLAKYLQPCIASLVLAIQRISKRHWHAVEHNLYNKLIVYLLQTSILSQDVKPILLVLQEYYPEARDKDLDALVKPTAEWVQSLEHLLPCLDQFLAPNQKQQIVGDVKKLIQSISNSAAPSATESPRGNDIVSSFWKSTGLERKSRLLHLAKDLVADAGAASAVSAEDRAKLETNLFLSLPEKYSDYLVLLLQLMKELYYTHQYDAMIALAQKAMICLDYCSESVRTVLSNWAVGSVVLSLEDFIASKIAQSEAANAAGGGKKAPPPKKGAETTEVPLQEILNTPARFKDANEDESQLQFALIAEIVQLIVFVKGQYPSVGNYFVRSFEGPHKRIDSGVDYSAMIASEETKGSEAPVVSPRAKSSLAETAFTKEDIIKYFSLAIDCFTQSKKANAALNASIKLWNFIVSEYLDPILFLKDFTKLSASQLRSVLLALSNIVYEASWNRNGLEALNPILLAFIVEGETSAVAVTDPSEVSAYIARESKERLSSLVDIIIFIVKVVWLGNQYPGDIVLYVSKIFTLYQLNAEFDCTMKLGKAVLPLVMHAQQRLVNLAKEDLQNAKDDVSKFVQDYEDAQAKKRKKKLRIARLEKDDEELAFEADKAKLEEVVANKQEVLTQREDEMHHVEHQQHEFDHMIPKGQQLLQRAKLQASKLIEEIQVQYGSKVDYRTLLHTAHHREHHGGDSEEAHSGTVAHSRMLSNTDIQKLYEQIEQIKASYRKAIKFLRENKEKVLLTYAIQDLINVFLRFGLLDECKQYLFDVVDGLFNTMDACLNWKSVCHQIEENGLEKDLIPGILNVIIALGKLSKYYTDSDYNTKSNYARMSAALALTLFKESIHHPTKLIGFAAYECFDLAGFQAIPVDSLHEILTAIRELVQVLMCEEQDLIALPLVVVGEHLSAMYLRHPRSWLDMRKLRIRILVKQHMFAEAISMLAGIKSRIQAIAKHKITETLRIDYQDEMQQLQSYDRQANGLCFFEAPAFFNHHLPAASGASPAAAATTSPRSTGPGNDNQKSLEWIAAFPAQIESYLSTFNMKIPESELSEEEKQKLVEKRQKAVEEAAEAAKKSKGKGPPPVEPNPDAELPVLNIFTSTQIIDIYTLCAQLLLEVATSDGCNQTTHSLAEFRNQQLQHAKKLISNAKESLVHRFTLKDIEEEFALRLVFAKRVSTFESSEKKEELIAEAFFMDIAWFELYGRIVSLEQRSLVYGKRYRQALLITHQWMMMLQHPHWSVCRQVHGDMKYLLSYFWFSCRYQQMLVASRQCRHQDLTALVDRTMLEVERVRFGFFERKYLFLQSQTYYLLKQFDASMQLCRVLLRKFEDIGLEDMLSLEVSVHFINLLREQIRYYNEQLVSSSKQRVDKAISTLNMYNILMEALQKMRKTYETAKQLMEKSGGYPVDFNLTFTRGESNINAYHLLAPVHHMFTDLHNNEPPLSISAMEVNHEVEAVQAQKRSHDRSSSNNSLLMRSQVPLTQHIRLGPVDANDTTFSPSEFVNIYLRESRLLLTVQVAYLILLDDIRNMGIGRLMHAILEHKKEEEKNNITGKKKKTPLDDYEEEDLLLLDAKKVLYEQTCIAEESLKLLRQVVFASPSLRGNVYLYAAKARISQRIPPGKFHFTFNVVFTLFV